MADQLYNYSELLGWVPMEHGDVKSRASERWPQLKSTIDSTAAEMDLAIHGAAVGQ